MKKLKIMTFNLKNNLTITKSKTYWLKRLGPIASVIYEEQPDIVGTQEMATSMRKYLEKLLPEYQFVAAARTNDRHIDDIANTILIKKEIEVLSSKIYSLGPNIYQPGSKNLLCTMPRSCNWAKVMVNQQPIELFNVHLDHLFQRTRNFQITQLEKIFTLSNPSDKAKIITGDFNMTYQAKLNEMCKRHHLYDAAKGLGSTFRALPYQAAIDHILLTDDFELVDCYLKKESYNGVFPSDHYPVTAKVYLKKP